MPEARLAVCEALKFETLWVATRQVGLSVGLYGIFYFGEKANEK
jgi:hypothetical protein